MRADDWSAPAANARVWLARPRAAGRSTRGSSQREGDRLEEGCFPRREGCRDARAPSEAGEVGAICGRGDHAVLRVHEPRHVAAHSQSAENPHNQIHGLKTLPGQLKPSISGLSGATGWNGHKSWTAVATSTWERFTSGLPRSHKATLFSVLGRGGMGWEGGVCKTL